MPDKPAPAPSPSPEMTGLVVNAVSLTDSIAGREKLRQARDAGFNRVTDSEIARLGEIHARIEELLEAGDVLPADEGLPPFLQELQQKR